MNVFQALSKGFQDGLQVRSSSTLGKPSQWLIDMVHGGSSSSGVNVNHNSAMTYAAVYACVRLLAETIASLPWDVMQIDGTSRRRIVNHPLHRLIGIAPNETMTQFDFWEWMIVDAMTRGVGYAIIKRDGYGDAIELHPQIFTDVHAVVPSGRKISEAKWFKVVGYADPIPADNMLIISNLDFKSPIQLFKEAIGLGMAADKYGGNFFGKGGNISGVLSSDQNLSPQQRESIEKSWNASRAGIGNSHSTAILPVSMKYHRITIPPNDSQFLETKKFQTQEVCRIFGVPPFMVQAESDTKYSNTEEQNRHFAQHTIRPKLKRFEAEVNKKLVAYPDRDTIKVKANMDALLRADTKSRAEYYDKMRKLGAFSINNILELEGMNPVEGGEQRFVQLNEIPLDKAAEYAESIIHKNKNSKGTTNVKEE